MVKIWDRFNPIPEVYSWEILLWIKQRLNDIKEIVNEVDYGTLEELEKDINSLVRKYSISTFNNALTRAIEAMLGE